LNIFENQDCLLSKPDPGERRGEGGAEVIVMGESAGERKLET
jgi:hypothetical protein